MDDVVEFRTADGAVVMVQGSGGGLPAPGFTAGDDVPTRAARTFEGALDGVRAAADSALRVFRDGSLKPDSVELEFGVTLSAEVGAVIAKGSGEGHLVVRLSWSPAPAPDRSARSSAADSGAAAPVATTPVGAGPVADPAPQPVPQRPSLPPQPPRLPGSAPLSQPVAVVVGPPEAGAGSPPGPGAGPAERPEAHPALDPTS
ncbi:CU044_2847 family protein [Streptomyces sp. NPDC008150]|uniref:CU044_2847 family protein n=1 Tax=Streptomyces sp. NPDC008150 TaxID=3364816 RepID=UPI0036E26573